MTTLWRSRRDVTRLNGRVQSVEIGQAPTFTATSRNHYLQHMKYDNSISPVGWYVATYLLRFAELAQEESARSRYLARENTILVAAPSIDVAYDKAVDFALTETEPYKGGTDGVDVKWFFEGIVSLVPVYEKLGDGAEIFWTESTRSLSTIRRRAMTKDEVRRELAQQLVD